MTRTRRGAQTPHGTPDRRTLQSWRAGIAGLALALAAPLALAEAADAQNPAPINAVEIDAGRRIDYTPAGQRESYYRITYRGSLVREQGTPFKSASGLDLTAPAPAEVGSGDRNKWMLRYENRAATLGGSLLEAGGLQPISLAGIDKLDLRGSAAVASDDAGTHLSVGLETPPFRIPGLAGTEVSNWLVFGVDAQRHPNAATTGTNDRGLVTYRAFIGKAFLWRKSADVHKTAERIEKEILKQAATMDEAKVLARKINDAIALRNQTPTPLQSLLVDAVGELKSDQDWAGMVRRAAMQEADAVTDQPTLALYVESTGWYTAKGTVDGRRFRNLLTATLDYWFLPARDDVFLRLRYEHGFEWAAPTLKRKQLLAAVALRF